MIGVAFVAAYLVAASDPQAKFYPSYGLALNWILGLPCWLIGCYAAERVQRSPTPSADWIWAWRVAVFGAAAFCSILRFHSPIGYPWSLNVFAILVGLWLIREWKYFQTHEPLRLLEWAGTWSYSLYLFHGHGLSAFAALSLPNIAPF